MSRLVDITGNRYNRLKVMGFSHCENKRSFWICECDCGKTVVLRKDHFAYEYSHQKSCGCLHRQTSSQLMKQRHEQKKKEKYQNEQ